ncbi:unnamed protein product [Darwinula stevensoni]|uniref:EFR3-like protein n=1 Tax=Darwinula stevensoni TaxID=69355 RepID=A0A7R9ADY0_9CRUS|nr:unnamed protein product [Darwinula stevensoni]CAG0901189.1 unnamed protein product [Darwinula stevensoni]
MIRHMTVPEGTVLETLKEYWNLADVAAVAQPSVLATRGLWTVSFQPIQGGFWMFSQEGLQKNNMDKLTFYALSSPEKLDRIGEYIAQRVNRDIRRKMGFVRIAMEAMDQLLLACHAQSLNLFVESFLKTIQKLLECPDPEMQVLGSQSFVKFSNIEEDTPSYHLRYDFFVCKFSSMCHDNNDDLSARTKIRMAGLKGLQGVVRKTVSDELVESIWEPDHMNKIVPSLLFNMSEGSSGPLELHTSSVQPDGNQSVLPGEEKEGQDPASLADICLRELVARAPYGKLDTVIQAMLLHLDNHKQWDPNNFAISVIRLVLFSIQAKYSQTVMQILMRHLDLHSKEEVRLRTGIADVIAQTITIAAAESVGLSPLEIINSLLMQLRLAVDSKTEASSSTASLSGAVHSTDGPNQTVLEERYQATLINALGEYANHLPDYQKIEIMKFVLGKVPKHSQGRTDILLQKIMLKSMLKVGTTYVTHQFSQTFQMNLVEPLLGLCRARNAAVRLLVQQILHTLIDRHNNLPKLAHPSLNPADLDLEYDQCTSADIQFFKRRGADIFVALYGSLFMDGNTEENILGMTTTLSLLCIEMNHPEVIVEMLRLIFSVQDSALTSEALTTARKFNLHGMNASLMSLLALLAKYPAFSEHVQLVIAKRLENAPHLLSPIRERYAGNLSPDDIPEELLFSRDTVEEALKEAGLDGARINVPYANPTNGFGSLQSQQPGSNSDINSIALEVESISSSPGLFPFRGGPEEQVTFDSLKRLLSEPPEKTEEEEADRNKRIAEMFQTSTFKEMLARQPSTDNLQEKLTEIFTRLTRISGDFESLSISSGDPLKMQTFSASTQDIQFPDLFVS